MSKEFKEIYSQALYFFELAGREVEITLDDENIEIDRLLKQHRLTSWAFITADNPMSSRLSDEENRSRNLKLESEIRSAGYIYHRGEGRDPDGSWQPEKSFLILGIDENRAAALGQNFGQAAIILGELNGFATLRMLPGIRIKD